MNQNGFYAKRLEKKTRYSLECPISHKFLTIFGSLAIKILIDDDHIYIGRGSYGAIQRIKSYKNYSEGKLLLRVGEFSEFSDCEIILGGTHDNSSLCNITFNAFPHVASEVNVNYKNIINPPVSIADDIIDIGNNVLVSSEAMLLSGTKIGDGSIVGARAVVSNNLECNGIFVGSPAKLLRPRFNEKELEIYKKIDWSTIDIHDFFYFISEIRKENFNIDFNFLNDIRRVENECCVIFRAQRDQNKRLVIKSLMGVEINGNEVAKLPEEMISYFSQASNTTNERIDWIPDPFDYFNIM